MIKANKKGFTLAETLLALTIIGVVAALVMGNLIAHTIKQQTVAKLQKTSTILGQALKKTEAFNGFHNYWDFPAGVSEQSTNTFFDDYLKSYLVLMEDCKTSQEKECEFQFKELNGTKKTLDANWRRFYLNDGMFVAMQTNGSDDYKVIYFYVDINGKSLFNTVARDIFMFEYWAQNKEHPEYEGKLLPYGHQYTKEQLMTASNEDNCNKSKTGNYCAAVIIKDDWKISNNYPW